MADPLAQAFRLFQAGRIAEARQSCDRALRLQPKRFEARYLMGVLCEREGRLEDAAAQLHQALQIRPRSFEVLLNLGIVQLKSRQFEDAIASLRKAVAANPASAMAHDVLGLALGETGQLDAARTSLRKAVTIKSDYAEAHMHLAAVHVLFREYDHAVRSARAALAVAPGLAGAHHQLGVALLARRQFVEATTHLRRAVAIDAALVDAHRALAIALREQGRHEPALASFHAALAIDPAHLPSLYGLANTLKQTGAYDAALAAYQAVQVRDPLDANALSMAAFVRRTMCAWEGLAAVEATLVEHVRAGTAAIMPFPFLAVTDNMADQLRCARRFWQAPLASGVPLASVRAVRHERIRIGYLSGDFHAHATAYLMAQLFEQHDRTRFDVFGLSYGPDDGSDMRGRLVSGFDRFIDLHEDDDATAARRIAEAEVDILVDLKGHTEFARLGILSGRPAPVQVHYIGYPGSLGTDIIDYLIVDPVVARQDEEALFSEKLVYLTCYQVNDRKRSVADGMATRAACGLPEHGFVFACFNNSYKITLAVFAVWMRLLAGLPGSVLWLLSDNHWAEENLRREAVARGVAADRLVFAPRVPMPEHLARQRLADLFLDTLPYNAHTTASDALWVGLPVLTVAGRSFAARVAASLLHAVGLPELVTHDLGEYERLALALARDPAVLARFRCHLHEARDDAVLFDIARTRAELEAAYREMWAIHCRGEPPRSFAAADLM